jgi:hypothetical protein
LGISYLLIVSAFFLFHLLLGLFPLFLQLVLLLLVSLLLWSVHRLFGTDYCIHHWDFFFFIPLNYHVQYVARLSSVGTFGI